MTSLYITINLPREWEMDDSWKETKEFIETMDESLKEVYERAKITYYTSGSPTVVIPDLYPRDADKLEIMFRILAFALGGTASTLNIKRTDEYFCDACGHWLISNNKSIFSEKDVEFDHHCPKCLKLAYVG